MVDEVSSICQECGASIYKEHLDSGIARYEGGKLMCSHCVSEYEQSHDETVGGTSMGLEAIAFDDDDDAADMSQSRIHVTTGSMLAGGGKWDDSRFKRPLNPKSDGATRCRTFHSKLNEGAIDFMTNTINEWIDGDESISVKFATTTIGIFEGKHPEPNLILTVFY